MRRLHPLTRILRQHLEFLVLELKEITEIERGGEPAYKLGPTLSSSTRYVDTVILYIKLKSRLPPRTSVTGLLKLLLPRDNYRLTTTHESKMVPMAMGDHATEHKVSELFSPRARTQPILFSGAASTLSRILHDFAGVKLVSTHRRMLFRITSGTSIAFDVVSKQGAEAANGLCKLVKRRSKLITIGVPRGGSHCRHQGVWTTNRGQRRKR